MQKNVTTVNFDEIFHFATKPPFKISWNECNDLFFGGPLTYKGYNKISLKEEESELKSEEKEFAKLKISNRKKYKDDPWYDELEEPTSIKTKKVFIAFMKKHKLINMLVLNA